MRRVLAVLMLAGAGYLLVPSLLNGFLPSNARCLNCRRDFYTGSETKVVCRGCRHLLPASLAKQYFNTPPDFPFAAPPTQPVRGKLPANTVER